MFSAVLDTSVLFAMLVYAIVAWLLSWLLEQIGSYLTRLDRDSQQAQDAQSWSEARPPKPTYTPMPPSAPPSSPPPSGPPPPFSP